MKNRVKKKSMGKNTGEEKSKKENLNKKGRSKRDE